MVDRRTDKRMDISPLINVFIDSKINETGIDQVTLKPGDVLRVKIVENFDDQRVLADFGRFRAKAEIKFPVKPGEEFMAKVVDTGSQLRLSVVHPDKDAVDRILGKFEFLSDEIFQQSRSEIQRVYRQIHHLADTQKLPRAIVRALSNIHNHFAALTFGENTAKLASDLRTYIERSGFFFEKRLEDILCKLVESSAKLSSKNVIDSAEVKRILATDLKPNLLRLHDLFDVKETTPPSAEAKNLAKIKSAVDNLLSDIANQQSLAVKRQLHPDPFHVLTFFLPLKENDQKAKLKVYYPKKKKDAAKNGFKISILLNMKPMGEIRSDLLLLNKDLTITFFVKDDMHKRAIDRNSPEIKRSLQHLFDYLIVRTVISNKKIEDFHREDWNFAEDKRVNVRI